jgi:pyruvate kinase
MQGLAFSSGVHPVDLEEDPEDWTPYTREMVKILGIPCERILLITGPSVRNPNANQRLELITC